MLDTECTQARQFQTSDPTVQFAVRVSCDSLYAIIDAAVTAVSVSERTMWKKFFHPGCRRTYECVSM